MRYRTTIFSLLFTASLLASCTAVAPSEPTSLQFETFLQHALGPAMKRDVVIDTREALDSLLEGRPSEYREKFEAIDFTQSTLIGTFMGGRSSGGYSTAIMSLTDIGGAVVAAVQEQTPGDCLAHMMPTAPYHFILTSKITKPVRFEKREVEGDCQ